MKPRWVVLAVAGLCLLRGVALAAPIVQITAPIDGFKLRQGRAMQVRVLVVSGESGLSTWSLRVHEADTGNELELARGSDEMRGAVVEVAASDLTPGNTYTLVLEAEDLDRTVGRSEVDFRIPDPEYTLIPIASGQYPESFREGLSVDGSGTLVVAGGRESGDLAVIDGSTGQRRDLHVPLASTSEQELSRDGRRFFFRGSFREMDAYVFGFGFLDLMSEAINISTRQDGRRIRVDRSGQRFVYQAIGGLPADRTPPARRTSQYFLYDHSTAQARQITFDPEAIMNSPDPDSCPGSLGTTPLISADGSRVVIATSATLGIAPEDPAVGCNVFVYNVDRDQWRHAASLPRAIVLDIPTLSSDGRWLSFTSTRTIAPEFRRSFPALLDVHTGHLLEPVGGITDFTSFDAVVSGDGSKVVISTQADLDPRVGNADHNMELFVYDRRTGSFTQVSETTGGIRFGPVSCPAYQPRVNDDARVIAFYPLQGSSEACFIDGPQINEVDGLSYARVRAVRRRPGNQGPDLTLPKLVRVLAGEILALDISAADGDDDPLTFFAQALGTIDLPPGSRMEDHFDGTATFRWETRPEDAGAHRLRVAAYDEGGGLVFHDVTVAICSRLVSDASLASVITALFESEPPVPCRDADRNGDGIVSAADLVGAVAQK